MFDPYTGIAFTASNEKIMSNPELLTLENNTAKYCFSDFSFETHAFYDKKSKKIIEHEEILIDGEPYRVEFIEDDSCLINNKKNSIFYFL